MHQDHPSADLEPRNALPVRVVEIVVVENLASSFVEN
jgi:hypothetical protein